MTPKSQKSWVTERGSLLGNDFSRGNALNNIGTVERGPWQRYIWIREMTLLESVTKRRLPL
jgi:hypothetical protein